MKETVRKYIESIKRSNSRFAKMSKAEKRVTVAKDVLKALDSKFLNATSGTYFETSNDKAQDFLFENREKSFQDTVLEGKVPECDVCAKGAIFTCAVMRQNKVTNEKTNFFPSDGHNLSDTLQGLFSGDQLNNIERYFEAYEQALEFYNPKKRMQLIMQNIVDNNGTFRPSKLQGKTCQQFDKDGNFNEKDCGGYCCFNL